jgi:hypothetical protein
LRKERKISPLRVGRFFLSPRLGATGAGRF